MFNAIIPKRDCVINKEKDPLRKIQPKGIVRENPDNNINSHRFQEISIKYGRFMAKIPQPGGGRIRQQAALMAGPRGSVRSGGSLSGNSYIISYLTLPKGHGRRL